MKLPVMNVIKKTTDGTNRFTGLDQRPKTKKTAFADMQNMTGELLPVMATRRPRGRVRTLKRPNGLFAHDRLCWVDGGDVYYDGQLMGHVTDGPKTFVRMAAYLLIWPDKVCINTHTGEWSTLEMRTRVRTGVTAALCRLDGEAYEYEIGQTAPENPEDGALWLDTSGETHVLKYWAEAAGMWTGIPTVYTKISAEGIGKGFKANDGVSLSGFVELTQLNGSFYLVDAADDWVIVVAMIERASMQTEPVTISRSVPDMDFVCEAGNRVWGCSNKTHEIFASALGDAKNWNRFLGLASDSYAATVGSAGDFTGAASHLGGAMFFKENAIHLMTGTEPANFTMSESMGRGVAKGSEKSLCHANELLMYKAPGDVCAMGMSTAPATVSDALGSDMYYAGVGGALDSRYYLSVINTAGTRELLVYDTATGYWVKEDELDVLQFAQLDGALYMLAADGTIWVTGADAPDHLKDETAMQETDVEWMLETGDIGLDEAFAKWISRIQIHMDCDLGSTLRVDVKYDGGGLWQEAYRLDAVHERSVVIPIRPKRCRTMRLRLHGTGRMELYSMVWNVEQGSVKYAAR